MIREVDPFDLPDWLGTAEVTWCATTGIRTGHRVSGALRATPHDGPHDGPHGGPHDGPRDELACDLLAVDEAYPTPVVDDAVRMRVHQAWRHGQVALLALDERVTLAVPGTGFDADRVLTTIGRLARSVGADEDRYAVLLRLGDA